MMLVPSTARLNVGLPLQASPLAKTVSEVAAEGRLTVPVLAMLVTGVAFVLAVVLVAAAALFSSEAQVFGPTTPSTVRPLRV